jgi:hypothetical protein
MNLLSFEETIIVSGGVCGNSFGRCGRFSDLLTGMGAGISMGAHLGALAGAFPFMLINAQFNDHYLSRNTLGITLAWASLPFMLAGGIAGGVIGMPVGAIVGTYGLFTTQSC